jgi:AAA domain
MTSWDPKEFWRGVTEEIARVSDPPPRGEKRKFNGGNAADANQPSPSPTAEDLKAMRFEPIKYVVRGLIVEGLTLLAAKPKIGKSWLMLHVAIAVAAGRFTLGEIQCEEGDVLYCALEDNLRRLRSRLEKLLGPDQPWPNRLCFKTEMPRLTEGGLAVIEEWIKSVPHPRLIVIDTLAMVRSPKKRDESNYEADYAAVQALRTLANQYGLAIVLIHHLRKAEADDPFDTVSGTLGLTGAPDTILVVKRDTAGNVILHGRGRDLIEVEKAMTFNKDSCTWTITGSASEARMSHDRRAILNALAANGEPATPAEIAALANLKPGNVKHIVIRMLRDGLLVKADRGKYAAAG